MRPNSLFFDRCGKQSFARTVSMIVTIAFLAMSGYFLIRYQSFSYLLHEVFLTTPMLGWLLLGYALLAVLFVLIIRWANCRVRRIPSLWTLAIFLSAFLPRVLVLLALNAPEFGSMAFTQANLDALFQIKNLSSLLLCAASALCAVTIYLIARRFDESSAPAAGLLYALYPANIVLCASQPNVQGVVLFALLSVLFALAAFSAPEQLRALFYSALSGLSLAVCGVVLTSVRLIALAFGVFWAVLFFSSLGKPKELVRLILIALTFCAVFLSLKLFALHAPSSDRLDANLSGVFSSGAAQQAKEGEALLDSLNWETLHNGYASQGSPARLDENIIHLWLEKDASLQKVTDEPAFVTSQLSPFAQGIRLLDFFYVAGILLFAWIGGLLRRRGGAGDLLLWMFLVWATAHLFSERQLITRAIGLPTLMIFSAYGVFAVVGGETRSKERSKYASCVNRGVLNLGDIPPDDESNRQQDRSCSSRAAAPQTTSTGGLFAAMEADLEQQKNTKESFSGG
jgi:hypothetical protein